MIVNAFNPWLSRTSIDKGAAWSTELMSALTTAKAGIVCLTPSNLLEPWILFEAGAIAKTVTEKPLACTLLIGLKSSDLSGPLTLFQDTKLTRDDLLHLIKTLNNAAGKGGVKEAQVEKTFDLVWPKLKEKLDNLPPDEPTDRPVRSEGEMIEEILDTLRTTTQQDNALLNQAVAGIATILRNIPSASFSLGGSQFLGLAGRTVPLSSLIGQPFYGTVVDAAADASTTGKETPIVPPAWEPRPKAPKHPRVPRSVFDKGRTK